MWCKVGGAKSIPILKASSNTKNFSMYKQWAIQDGNTYRPSSYSNFKNS